MRGQPTLRGSLALPLGFEHRTEHYYGRPRMWSLSVDFVF